MKKLRIGFLLKEMDNLENWELRIINSISKNSILELVLLIIDTNNDKNTLRSKDRFRFSEISNILGLRLFENQISQEKLRFGIGLHSDHLESNRHFYKSLPKLELNSNHNNSKDYLCDTDIDSIKKYNLDIIINYEFNPTKFGFIDSAKFGVFSLGYSTINGPPGLWEILFKKDVVTIDLVNFSRPKREGVLVDQSHFNPHGYSYVLTHEKLMESSVSMIIKNLEKLFRSELIVNDNKTKPDISLGLSFKISLRYFINYYFYYLKGAIRKRMFKSFGIRYNCWTLFIGYGNFLDTDLSSLKPVPLPKSEFWADPFLFSYEDETYAFFENYSYKTKRGKISCGKIKNQRIIEVKDVLDFKYHLSFPYIFEDNGEIYLMPESNENNRLEIYRCIEFPIKWELFTTAFQGEKVADAFFHKDEQNQKWLFINKIQSDKSDRTSELYIYKVDSIKLNRMEPHTKNPVLIDSSVARNAGEIFEYNEKLFRPSQSNTHGVYGKALNINEIEKLTIDEYSEKRVKIVNPNFMKGFTGIHHLHQHNGMFVFDAAIKKLW